MTTELIESSPWPAEPRGVSELTERLSWYAAVARWAPSKHNAQPWRFEIRAGALELWSDDERGLPATDPQQRELMLSCGAALQLICVAARALGRAPVVSVLPQGGATSSLV